MSLSPTGNFRAYNLAGSVHVIIDVNGYYTDSSLEELHERVTAVESARIVTTTPNSSVDLPPGVDTVVATLSLTTAVPGMASVTSSGYVYFLTAGYELAYCTLTRNSAALDAVHRVQVDDYKVETSQAYVPFSSTRAFPVPAGTTTFRLVCRELAGDVIVRDTTLSAIFLP